MGVSASNMTIRLEEKIREPYRIAAKIAGLKEAHVMRMVLARGAKTLLKKGITLQVNARREIA